MFRNSLIYRSNNTNILHLNHNRIMHLQGLEKKLLKLLQQLTRMNIMEHLAKSQIISSGVERNLKRDLHSSVGQKHNFK